MVRNTEVLIAAGVGTMMTLPLEMKKHVLVAIPAAHVSATDVG
jgi:hypothetical protein